MKKLIFTLSILFSAVLANGQTTCTWHEEFDPPSLGDSVTAYCNNPGHNWGINTRLFVSAPNSDSAYLGHADTLSLTAGPINFDTMNFVLMSFDQICKISFFDKAEVQYSYDGNNWTKVPFSCYLGQAPYQLQGEAFSSASYGDWFPGLNDTIPFDNTWWKHEPWDLSSIAAGIPTFWLRWEMYDAASDLVDTLNGWKIENICIQAAPCELNPPVVVQQSPFWNNITYSLGPYITNVSDTDQSGILHSYLIYTINGIGPDTVEMTAPVTLYDYTGDIPAVNAGDSVCYWFSVIDASGCDNTTTTSPLCFVASPGITFPYCLETFDAAVLWTDTTVAPFGSTWDLGTPAFGATTGAHSPPNAWDIDLTSGYLTNSECYLYSPVFNPNTGTTVNARLTFWQNRQTGFGDGVTLQYSGDGSTWATLTAALGTAVNWHNGTSNFDGQPIWDQNSNGWIKSDFIFGPTNLVGTQFQLRFRFASSFGSGAGFSLDDLCFTLPEPNDPGLANIVSPTGNAPAGTCLPVTVTIHNYGSNSITSTDVYYNYGGVTSGPFTWTGGPLAPGAEVQFTMPCDSIEPGLNTICAWVVFPGDPNHFNDTTCATMFGIPTVVMDSLNPYCDGFDTGTSLWYNEDLSGNVGNTWQQGAPTCGCTNNPHSAPNVWGVNIANCYQNNANVALNTPFFDITGAFNPYLDFWINRNTELNWDGVRLEYTTDLNPGVWTLLNPPVGTTNWYNMPSIICSGQPAWAGTPCDGWTNVRAEDLSSMLVGNPSFVQFRFVFCSDGSVIYDSFNIDDFCFAMPAPFDAGIPQIIQPSFSAAAGTCSPVEVTIKNFGYNPLTSIDVYYSNDDIPYGNPVTFGPFTWTGTLAPGASTTWVLPVCDTVPAGQYNFCSWTDLVVPLADGNFFNDTTCTTAIGVPTIPLSYTNSYCDDFDSVNIGWSVETLAPGSVWEWGPPAFGTTNSAHSAPNAWDVNLNTAYNDNALTRLYTPYFNFTQAVNTKMNFWVNYNTWLANDGVRCEFRIGTNPWTQLFNTGIGFTNWYNSIACSNAGWSGNSSTLIGALPTGWAPVSVESTGLANLNGMPEVQFRFTFCSGAFGFPTDGFSIDDFCLEVPVPLTAAPTTCHNTSNPPFIFPGQPISFDSDIKNPGTTPLDSVIAQVLIDGVPIVTDAITFSPPLAYNQSQNHVFSGSWITTPGVHDVCIVTSAPNGGVDLNPTDDTLCCSISVIDTVSVASGPYCPDFDTAPQWVTLNSFPPYAPNTSWTFGDPNIGFMTDAHTGTNAWKVGPLNANYPNTDSSALFTPAFNIQVGRTYNLSFWHMYAMEAYQDGGNVEYSTDFGGSWNVLGTAGTTSWYDSYFVTALGGTPPMPGWSIASQAWTNPHHEICFQPQNGQLAYPVMFRFRFASDYSVNNLGWLIDDFCFEDIGNCPVGIEEETSASGLILGQNRPNPTNGMTSIDYIIPENGNVVLNVVNLLGQVMDTPVDEEHVPGRHTVSFNTNKLSPGIYYYSLTFNKETLVKKMVITK